ncbi:uncharacterized protein LOC108908762 [Anoplophora glabripennis]|uniref:uncharacterized protein LOC108908762 n=1 Tax=Anoplophora glabripennis TaxID=217634 RepID=UPI00087499ED|nr:uncharacterized protein LOC108908762 [Anoplophora glabripennis]
MASNNNKRSNNFSKNEERILLDIVYKHKEIIECKKTDTVMNRKKVEIWVGITKEFNAVSGETFRDAKTLKNKYENLKKRTKHKAAEERQALLRTGGGPYIESKMDSTETKILDLLGVRAKGMQSEFGDDTISFPIPQETVSARDISATGDDTSTVILLETEQDIPETFTIDGPSTSSENNREDGKLYS